MTHPLLNFESELWPRHRHLVGIDEAGRGAWAGPVVAAAVVFEPGFIINGVDDSKKLTATKREKLFSEITSQCLSYGIGIIDSQTVDEINILQATKRAMLTAVTSLKIAPDFLLIDGNMGIESPIPQKPIIDGDALSFTIAAASIIAKVTRDRLMVELAGTYPDYGFDKHKGYGTKDHQSALAKVGCCDIHRRSYAPIAKLFSI